MKKVFVVHGFEGSPNGGWRPWLMGELEKKDIYACALSMPTPEDPKLDEWVDEIARHVERSQNDEIYLVGHSLGVPAILNFIDGYDGKEISGVVLVSGLSERVGNEKVDRFFAHDLNFESIKDKVGKIVVIHGDNDPRVPRSNAEFLAREFECDLIVVPNGGHLNGSSGWTKLPQCLEALLGMMK